MGELPTEQEIVVPDEGRRRGQLVLQAIPIALIPLIVPLVGAIVVLSRFSVTGSAPLGWLDDAGPRMAVLHLGLVVVVIVCSALVLLVRLGRPTISAVILIGAWSVLTTGLALQHGATTFWPALLIVPICAAGLLLDGAASVLLAVLATLLVGAFAWLETQGLHVAPIVGPPDLEHPPTAVSATFWTILFWSVAALTSLLAGGVQRALQQSRAQAAALRRLSAELEARVAAQTAELAQRAGRAEALHEVGRALTSTLELPQVLALITEHAARLLGFEAAVVLLAGPDDAGFTAVSSYQQPLQPADLDRQHGLLTAVVADRRPRAARVALGAGAAPAEVETLVLPMRYGAAVTGILMLLGAPADAGRAPDDLALAEGLADQAAIAIANAQLLAHSRERATLEERTRLARDIHDTLAQGLTGVVVQLGAARQALDHGSAEVGQHLELAQRLARESLAEARRSVWNLRAPALERGDLADALRGLAARPLRPATAVGFELRGEPWALSPGVESALLRVGQEALANVAKHARASEARVVLDYRPEAVQLTISDDGIGLDPDALLQTQAPADPWTGFGLLGMRERLAALGGTLELTSDGGAQVRAVVPRAGTVGRPAGTRAATPPDGVTPLDPDRRPGATREGRAS